MSKKSISQAEIMRKISALLRRPLSKEDIDRNFVELGLDSLNLIQLVEYVEFAFGVRPTNRQFFEELSSVSALSGYIDAMAPPSGDTRVFGELIEGTQESSLGNPTEELLPFQFSDLQQAYWLGRKNIFQLGNVSPHAWFEYDCGRLDVKRLEYAWNKLVERHGMLRTIAISDDEQQVLPAVPHYHLLMEDVITFGDKEAESHLDAVRNQVASRLETDLWPSFSIRIVRLPKGRDRMFFAFDLVTMDGRSLRTILAEWGQLYQEYTFELPPISLSYRQYIIALNSTRSTHEKHLSLQYWAQRLKNLPPAPDVPLARDISDLHGYVMTHYRHRIDKELWARFKSTATQLGLTPTAAVCAVYCDVLRCWSNNYDFTLNVLVEKRPLIHPDMHRLVGSCTTTILLEVSGSGTFLDRAKRLQNQLWKDLAHIGISGVHVMRELNRELNRSGVAAMPFVFSSELALDDNTHGHVNSSFPGRHVQGGVQTPYVLFDNQVREKNGELLLEFDVVDEAFPRDLPNQIIDAYMKRLQQLAKYPKCWMLAIADVLPQEHRDLIETANATRVSIPPGLLHEGIFEMAKAQPDAPALLDSAGTVSYAKLCSRSLAISKWLTDHGATANELVAITMRKGREQVFAAIGILSSGAAYVPIDPDLPRDRILYLLKKCEVRLVLTELDLMRAIAWPDNVKLLAVDDMTAANESAFVSSPTKVAPTDLAYVIFTSGSTGDPKGVMIDHRGALNTVIDINRRFGVKCNDRVLAISSLNFDLSVYDIFGVLTAGGSIVIPDADQSHDPSYWADLVRRYHVTLWNSVPALFDIYVEMSKHQADNLTPIRLVLLSGDWIPPVLPIQARTVHPQIDIVSLGGATEASIWSIYYRIGKNEHHSTSIPYGKALANQTVYVLGENLEPRPVGVAGEIYIGGIGITKGYWRDDVITGMKLVRNTHTGALLYRTGDLGRLMQDGNIEFLGRSDFQVKVRGLRVELKEIEHAIIQYPAVKDCVVAARGAKMGDKSLVAYIVPVDREGATDINAIRAHVAGQLPAYMVPEVYVLLKALPLSPNGKVDRKALPVPEVTKPNAKDEPDKNSDLIWQVRDIWRDVLGRGDVGLHDNFFDLGGNSLLAMRVFARLQSINGERLPLAVLFEDPTIAALVRRLAQGSVRQQKSETVVAIHNTPGDLPIYLIHPIGGNVLCYAALQRALGDARPIIGLQAVGLNGDVEPLESIETMAERYLADIRRLCPPASGGWCLVGWSMGGVIAYEMAHRLSQSGSVPTRVVIIDGKLEETNCDLVDNQAMLLEWFSRDLTSGRMNHDFLSTIKNEASMITSFLEKARITGMLPHETDENQFQALFKVFCRHASALARYQAPKHNARIDVVVAQHSRDPDESAARWLNITGKLAKIHWLNADHYDVMYLPVVQQVADIIHDACADLERSVLADIVDKRTIAPCL